MEDTHPDLPTLQNQEDKYKFNFSFETLRRINMALIECANGSMSGDINHWHNSLLFLYREVNPLLLDKDLAKYENSIIKAKNIINTLRKENKDIKGDKITPEFYEALNNFEIELRRLLYHADIYIKKGGQGGFNMFGL